MTGPTALRYRVFGRDEPFVTEDPWDHLRAIFQTEGPDDGYWSARAFALDGRLEIMLRDGLLVWGGPLLDIAEALVEWSEESPNSYRFDPLEQAPSVTITRRNETCEFMVGGVYQGSLDLSAAQGVVRALAAQLGADVRSHVPADLIPARFAWIAAR